MSKELTYILLTGISELDLRDRWGWVELSAVLSLFKGQRRPCLRHVETVLRTSRQHSHIRGVRGDLRFELWEEGNTIWVRACHESRNAATGRPPTAYHMTRQAYHGASLRLDFTRSSALQQQPSQPAVGSYCEQQIASFDGLSPSMGDPEASMNINVEEQPVQEASRSLPSLLETTASHEEPSQRKGRWSRRKEGGVTNIQRQCGSFLIITSRRF